MNVSLGPKSEHFLPPDPVSMDLDSLVYRLKAFGVPKAGLQMR